MGRVGRRGSLAAKIKHEEYAVGLPPFECYGGKYRTTTSRRDDRLAREIRDEKELSRSETEEERPMCGRWHAGAGAGCVGRLVEDAVVAGEREGEVSGSGSGWSERMRKIKS